MQVRVIEFLDEWTITTIADGLLAQLPLLRSELLLIIGHLLEQAGAAGLLSLETFRAGFSRTNVSLLALDLFVFRFIKGIVLFLDQVFPELLKIQIELAAEEFAVLKDVLLTDEWVEQGAHAKDLTDF